MKAQLTALADLVSSATAQDVPPEPHDAVLEDNGDEDSESGDSGASEGEGKDDMGEESSEDEQDVDEEDAVEATLQGNQVLDVVPSLLKP